MLVTDLKATGLTKQAIADEVGISRAAVKQRLNRARKRAARQQPTLVERYAKLLSPTADKPLRVRPFSLSAND